MDLIRELGELALATRLKRLSDRLMQDVSRVYKEADVSFESKWFLVLELLNRRGTLSIVEISQALKLSHPAIVQFVEQMAKKKLIKTAKDSLDARKRMVSLAPGGRKVLEQLKPILEVTRKANQEWLNEVDTNLLSLLDKLEQRLEEQSMYQRIRTSLAKK